MDSRDETQVVGLGQQALYPLSQLATPPPQVGSVTLLVVFAVCLQGFF